MKFRSAVFSIVLSLAGVQAANAVALVDYTYSLTGGGYTVILAEDPPITGTITTSGSFVATADILVTGIAGSFNQIANQGTQSGEYYLALNDPTSPGFRLTLFLISPASLFSGGGAVIDGPSSSLTFGGFPYGDQITGTFTVASAVPEPSTWAMMLLGFAGVGFMTYRRRHQIKLGAV